LEPRPHAPAPADLEAEHFGTHVRYFARTQKKGAPLRR
jgi:hypothetical protein